MHATDVRIAQRWKETFGARSDVSLAHTATDDRDEHGFVRGKNEMLENETIAGAMCSPRPVKEVLKALGKQLVDGGQRQSVLSWTNSRLS